MEGISRNLRSNDAYFIVVPMNLPKQSSPEKRRKLIRKRISNRFNHRRPHLLKTIMTNSTAEGKPNSPPQVDRERTQHTNSRTYNTTVREVLTNGLNGMLSTQIPALREEIRLLQERLADAEIGDVEFIQLEVDYKNIQLSEKTEAVRQLNGLLATLF